MYSKFQQVPVMVCDSFMMSRMLHVLPLTDVDECFLGTDTCQESCLNNPGSYRCHCREGYTVDTDGSTCVGMYHIELN